MRIVNILALLLIVLVLTNCNDEPPGLEVTIEALGEGKEEIHFHSDRFEVVGELQLPEGPGPFPAVILVHGDGPVTRKGIPGYATNSAHFLEAGFAVFTWDKPGSGESTGNFDEGHTLNQRSSILADGVQVLVEHPDIDPERIGLWGISQAGWVMPLALEQTADVAFLIVISGGGEDSIEQMAFQIGQRIRSRGGTNEEVARYEEQHARMAKSTTYAEYREAMEIILEIPKINQRSGVSWEMVEEDDWRPWPRDIDAFFDPMEVIEHITIPMLVFFGGQDVYIDPVQGAEAYEAALQSAGNQDYQIVVLPDAGHVLTSSAQYTEILVPWIRHLTQQ